MGDCNSLPKSMCKYFTKKKDFCAEVLWVYSILQNSLHVMTSAQSPLAKKQSFLQYNYIILCPLMVRRNLIPSFSAALRHIIILSRNISK